MSTPQATDKVLVNRSGVNYQAPADMSTVQDTDLILVNRGGVDYKCSAADWKNTLGGGGALLPDVGAVTVSDVAGGNRFTSTAFPVSATMTENGNPPSQKRLKAYVEGTLKVSGRTDVITVVEPSAPISLAGSSAGTEATSITEVRNAFDTDSVTYFGFEKGIGGGADKNKRWNFSTPIPLKAGDTVRMTGVAGGDFYPSFGLASGHVVNNWNPYVVPANTGITYLFAGAYGVEYQFGRITQIFVNDYPLLETSAWLTFAGDKDFTQLAVGDLVSEEAAALATGRVAVINSQSKQLFVKTDTGAWAVGQRIRGPEKTVMITPETGNITQVTQTGSVFIERQGPSMQERRAVAWGNGRFVVISSLSANQATLTSTNGEDWTAGSLGGSLGDGREIAYGNGYFVAVGTGGMRRSADGLSWETGTNPVNAINSFQYFAEHSQFLACKHDGNVVGVYKDNNTWTTATLSDSSSRPWQAALNPIFGTNGRYVLTCAGTSQWYYSDDRAVSWNVMTGPGTPPSGAFWAEWRNVVYSSKLGKFFSYSFNAQATRFWTASSSNGITWTVVEHNNVGGPMEGYGYRWVPELERIMSIRSDGSFYSTADGYTWNTSARCSAATASGWYGWAYSPTLNKTVAFPVSGNNTAMNVATGAGFVEHTLTFDSTAGLTQFTAGSTATLKGGGASGKVGVVSTTPTPKMSITDTTGTWTTGKTVTGTPVASTSVRLYAKLDANQNVTDLQSADPGFNTWNPQTVNPFAGTINLPTTLQTGNTPDVDLPAGTTLTVQVQASNDHGTDTATSNTITPA